MLYRFTSLLSTLRGSYRFARHSRLTLGIAVAVAVSVTGMLIGLSVGADSSASAVSSRGITGHSKAVRTTGQGASPAPIRRQPVRRPTAIGHSAGPQHRVSPQRPFGSQRETAPRQPMVAIQPVRPYLIYDSVTPSAIPAHQKIATYANGDYAVRPSQVARRGSVLWIDTNGSDPAASVLDVEPGDATPSVAASWALRKLSAQPSALACIYTMRSWWPATRAAVTATLPSWMCSHVRWWIADPTGVPHIVPGSQATQWYWGQQYDISTATPQFLVDRA